MFTTLVVSAVCLLLLGTVVGVKAVRATRARHWLGGTIRGLAALLLLAVAAVAATVTVGLQGYRAVTYEEVAATVRADAAAPLGCGARVGPEFGSATSVAGPRPATFEVRVSTTGLLARPVQSRSAP